MTHTPRLSLRGLRTFCVAARHENFRKAAEDLFITASAVSHQIKSLEQELGASLFDRDSRALKLTATGSSLFEEISPLILELDAVAARYKAEGARRSLRISVQPFFASELFVPRLREFTAEHPEIDIQVDTSDETSEKHPTNADASIRLFRSPPQDLSSDRLLPLRLVPAGSPEFRREMKVQNRVIVGKFPIIVHDTRPKAWSQWASAAGIELPDDTSVIRLDSMIAVARAAERGIGAALVPMPLSKSWFDSGSLVRLFDEELIADDGYYLVCNEDKANQEEVCMLREWVLQNFTQAP